MLELDLGDRRPSLAGPQAAAGPGRAVGRQGGLRGGAAGPDRRPAAIRHARAASRACDGDLGHGDVVIAAITSCTNTSNPGVMIAAGLLARNARRRGPEAQALGQDLAGARLAGGHRLSREDRAAGGSRRARLRSGRLRLHHLHRQLRTAARAGRARRSTSTSWSPPRCCPATATSRAGSTRRSRPTIWPRRRWWSPMRWPAACASTSPASRSAPAATASRSICATSGRARPTSRPRSGAASTTGMFRSAYADVFKGDAHWAKIGGARRRGLRLGGRQHLRPAAALLRGHAARARADHDIAGARVLALLGDSITTDHISPAGSIARKGPAGGLPDGAPGPAAGLQLLRLAPRQPRGHDARHLRQHPPAQRGRARHRGRLDPADAGRRGDVDLRCRDAVPGARRAAGGRSAARSTARAHRATGRPRARCCSASRR